MSLSFRFIIKVLLVVHGLSFMLCVSFVLDPLYSEAFMKPLGRLISAQRCAFLKESAVNTLQFMNTETRL